MRCFSSKRDILCLSIIVISCLLRVFFLGNRDLLVEEAYYWNYAIHLDFGYIDHPPLVAILIKLSTAIFGLNEFGVRFPAFLCWIITTYFLWRLTESINKGAGIYVIVLSSILPFLAVFSIIITPDIPLMACWSTALYMLYKALCLEEKKAWYYAGIAVGLGLLAKYTMALLIMTTGIYLLAIPNARVWFTRKEPYIAAIIILLLFSPVLYWNATHDWISFTFQSTRRLELKYYFTFHYFIGLLFLFLTPMGFMGLCKLSKKKPDIGIELDKETIRFFRYYTLLPLAVFACFSLAREIKFDWIAPALLGVLPWIAVWMKNKEKLLRHWFNGFFILLIGYGVILFCIAFGRPEIMYRTFFGTLISWEDLTHQLSVIAQPLEKDGKHPIFISIDSYAIPSELVFYQAKQKNEGKTSPIIPVHSANLFGFDSLMFRFWDNEDLQNRTIILVSRDYRLFDLPSIRQITTSLSPVILIWGHTQGQFSNLKPYYYQLVKLK